MVAITICKVSSATNGQHGLPCQQRKQPSLSWFTKSAAQTMVFIANYQLTKQWYFCGLTIQLREQWSSP
ncbi:hypothetical protein DPMN_061150 [Dreissena polymorpha]|uniref:Uncharacterized protein n=1 Tax=Dreissena polymorpha TaxID=45954 RepID=A0A9D4C6H0_DREPO|nr:hypothetical protein DPMN_061150 [Dreissena polymorpha]